MSMSTEELDTFVRQLAADASRWEHLIRHCGDVRVFELIWEDEDVNAWVICWSEDQDTGFHDHDSSEAAVAVISGQVREDRLRLGNSPQSRVLGDGSAFSVPASSIHRVLHHGEEPAVTIHAYSPPLVRTGAYRVSDDGTLERESLTIEHELHAEPALA